MNTGGHNTYFPVSREISGMGSGLYRELRAPLYCANNGRPSIPPEQLFLARPGLMNWRFTTQAASLTP